jgi:anti-anti-sigma factor
MGLHERNHGTIVDPDPLLQVVSHRLPTAVVVAAGGEIDLATADRLVTAVRAEFDLRPGIVVIELSAVTFLSSIGLAVLLEAQRTADGCRQLLRIVVGDGRPVARSVAASGLSDHLPLFRTLDEALTAA